MRDAFLGLAPSRPSTCSRCGSATVGLANGHGRLDLCSPCGIVEFSPVDGQGAFRLRVEGTEKRAKPVRVEPDEWYRGRGSSSRLKREA